MDKLFKTHTDGHLTNKRGSLMTNIRQQ